MKDYQELRTRLRQQTKNCRDKDVRVKVELILLAKKLGNVSEAALRKTHFLVRLRDKQRHIEPGVEIFDPTESTIPKGRYKIQVQNKDGKSRTAKIEVKYYTVNVMPPAARKRLPSVAAYVITAIEISPPKDAEAVDWKLITDLRITSFRSAPEKINW